MAQVLLVEPYFAGSHRAWAEGYAAASRHDVHLVTHAGRHWKWRMQGGALTLAAAIDRHIAGHGRPDVLLVSGMVHLPALLGLARRSLGDVPVALYLHENQLTYPLPGGRQPDRTYAMTNWLSMAAADLVIFNSDHHRRDLAEALPRFLAAFPDEPHGDGRTTRSVDEVLKRSTVLPVGVDIDRFAGSTPQPPRRTRADPARGPVDNGQNDNEQSDGPPVVLWNHRWEYDKNPGAFAAALHAVADRGVDFRLSIIGQNSDEPLPAFTQLRQRFGDRTVAFGPATPDEYPARLRQADIVVSTAHHEFFGVAVVEAVAAGALPVLPDRLSYPELVPPPTGRYLYRDRDDLVERLARALVSPAERRTLAAEATAFVQQFAWEHVAPRYDEALHDLAPGFSRR